MIQPDEAMAIVEAAARVEVARSELQATVDRARAAGATWHDVGAALGISRQAAWERFRS